MGPAEQLAEPPTGLAGVGGAAHVAGGAAHGGPSMGAHPWGRGIRPQPRRSPYWPPLMRLAGPPTMLAAPPMGRSRSRDVQLGRLRDTSAALDHRGPMLVNSGHISAGFGRIQRFPGRCPRCSARSRPDFPISTNLSRPNLDRLRPFFRIQPDFDQVWTDFGQHRDPC